MNEDLEATLTRHLARLSREIGPRPNGSPGNHAAAAYIQGLFEQYGLEVERQEYACPAWECDETILEFDGAPLEAAANAFSPPCDLSAPLAPIGSLEQLEAARLEGRIAVLYGDLARAPLAAKAWFLKDERDERIVALLEEKAPPALITVQASGAELPRLIEDADLAIPSATVPARAGLALIRKPALPARLRIASRRSEGHSCNLVGRKPGASPAWLVLCAHYDTMIDTPGALDNASGVSVLLALASLLGRKELRLGLELVAFSGEEYLPMGDVEYARRAGERFNDIEAAINADGVGQWLGSTSMALIAGSQPFHERLVELKKQYPGVVWVPPWPESNHSTYSFRGVPSLAFSTAGGLRLEHRRDDTLEWLSPARLAELVALIREIVESLQQAPPGWTRPPASQAADPGG